MVKKICYGLMTTLLISSCQQEELITFVPTQNETTPLVPENEADDTMVENNFTDPTLHWIANQQVANGLLTSSENYDLVSLYDNALAAILFIKKEEQNKAEQILNFFNDRIQTEFEMHSGGFYQFRNSAGNEGNRRWLGDNAWLLIAINHYQEAYNTNRYELLANTLEDWIRLQQDIDGSLFGGFNEDGSAIPKVTEGIITAFNAVPGYDDFHKNILSYLAENRWHSTQKNLMAWPENEAYLHALDVFTLSQGIFEDFPQSSLALADELFLTTQVATVTGQEITGYCFDQDKDVVWLEGSAQMAVALQTIGNTNRAEEVFAQIDKSFIQSFTTENAKGVPYAANYGSSYGPSLLWDHADITPALSSTIWYLFAEMEFNPLLLGKQKNIPMPDKFWLE